MTTRHRKNPVGKLPKRLLIYSNVCSQVTKTASERVGCDDGRSRGDDETRPLNVSLLEFGE